MKDFKSGFYIGLGIAVGTPVAMLMFQLATSVIQAFIYFVNNN